MATGWLGWSDAEALTTPVPRILLAVEGRTEWARLTNPFGSEKPSHGGIAGARLTSAGTVDLSGWTPPSPAELDAKIRGRFG
ncbi:MAG: hypothetical protein R8L07_03415 [Alphaproteobacteria bacterium]|nr:hypothetical protein [Alphaproteobacteria bacterium]